MMFLPEINLSANNGLAGMHIWAYLSMNPGING